MHIGIYSRTHPDALNPGKTMCGLPLKTGMNMRYLDWILEWERDTGRTGLEYMGVTLWCEGCATEYEAKSHIYALAHTDLE